MNTTYRFPFSFRSGVSEQVGCAQNGLCGLGWPGTHEIVAAVGELVQLDMLGQQLPIAVPFANPAVAGSSAATTTVTGADSRSGGGLSRTSARYRFADT